MVGSNGTMIAIRLVRSKLRKREEHSNSVHPAPAPTELVLQQAAPSAQQRNSPPLAYRGQFLWHQPPSQQGIIQQHSPFTVYSNDQNVLVSNYQQQRARNGFCQGFRKNLGGRWRRLVKREPPSVVDSTCTIPAELKPQLKQIYVY